MDILTTLGTVIVGGSALGATIAGFFAYRQKSLVDLLRESNNDYRNRVKQLEEDRDALELTLKEQARRIKALENEKKLPLERLTKLIVEHHTQQLEILRKIAENIGKENNT